MIDILRGADTVKIRQNGHESLSTYGIGADLDAQQWRSVFRQLVAAGPARGRCRRPWRAAPDPASGAVLKGERTLPLRTERPRPRDVAIAPAARAARVAVAAAGRCRRRFDALRQWRGETARANKACRPT